MLKTTGWNLICNKYSILAKIYRLSDDIKSDFVGNLTGMLNAIK